MWGRGHGAGQDGQARLQVGGPSLSCCWVGKWQKSGGGVKDDPQVLMRVGCYGVASFGEAEGGAGRGRGW